MPKVKLKVATLNVAGLNDTTNKKMGGLLRWANEINLDILCIQEHNGSQDKLTPWKNLAHRAGFCIALGADRGHSVRGGTAILARKSTFSLENADSCVHCEFSGRLTRMKVVWEGKQLTFVSMYVPVQAERRKEFLVKLQRAGSLGRNSIVMGDFNCVENEQLDVRYAEDNGTVYDNAHHGLLMMLLARAKLGNVFRKVHGPTATCYTRECKTVRTRLDRIYSTEYSSDIVWHSHNLDDKYAKNITTDHEPVVAEMALLGEDRASKAKLRINKELFEDKDTYDNIC